jgi:hypothetical protein
MTCFRVARLGSMAVLALLAVAPPVAPASAASDEPTCAWPDEVGADSLNIALPDTNAVYWVMPFQVRADREITVTGEFPDARYMSFTVYDG